ncbi:hypothetical protein AVEN_151888-1 [Araneus ventricosus]|uniref:Uncharacterized protein n=1 Tax=Araneus ventricosus TaxID=182803 RepID=A0A4Y2V844_ARAVE|nr:hypothetical protein AVEN_151888-1 [Araneus ventricosus]
MHVEDAETLTSTQATKYKKSYAQAATPKSKITDGRQAAAPEATCTDLEAFNEPQEVMGNIKIFYRNFSPSLKRQDYEKCQDKRRKSLNSHQQSFGEELKFRNHTSVRWHHSTASTDRC